MKAIVTELITNMRHAIVDKETGFRYMITNKRTEELQLLFKCYKWEPQNLGVIIACMQEHIEKIGRGYNEDETIKKDPIKFTQALLDFKKEVDQMIIECFQSNLTFEKARDHSFQTFMNENSMTPAFIAQYTHQTL